jgi:hypothetical protein
MAGFRARLAVIMIVGTALLGTPITDLCADRADILGELALFGHRFRTQHADRRAFVAAVRTVVAAVFADHFR